MFKRFSGESIRRVPRFWFGLALGMSTVLAVQVAIAAGDVTYKGCKNDATGLVRLLPSASLPAPFNTSCNTTTTNSLLHETPVSWSQTGPQGAVGATGAAGPKGDTGEKGDPGTKGDAGAAGATGATGVSGAQGPTGPQGPSGSSGTPGPTGAQGPAGPQGAAGPVGSTGATGPAGSQAGIDDLAGKPCHTSLVAPGTLQVSYDLAGNVTLKCGTPDAVLTVTRSGLGHGTVTSGTNLNCGSVCTHSYPPGTQVTLTAAADAVSTFAGWGAPCGGNAATCTFTINATTSVDANFTALPAVHLSISMFGTGHGTVSARSDANCPPTCVVDFIPGSTVTLTATSDATSVFAGWTGACAGAAASCSFTISADSAVVAEFDHANLVIEVVGVVGSAKCWGEAYGYYDCWFTPGGTVTGRASVAPAPTIVCSALDYSAPDDPYGSYTPVDNVVRCLFSVPLDETSATGTIVTLREIPQPAGNDHSNRVTTFAGWQGACTGIAPSCIVQLPNDGWTSQVIVTAKFH